MADVKWIKLDADIFNNRKIKQIRKMPDGDAIVGIWLQILCIAGQINDNGMVYFTKDVPYTEDMLSAELDRPIATIRLALLTFQKFNMLDIINDIMLVSNWEKYQSIDKLKKIKEQSRLRKQKQRSIQSALGECHVTCHADVTQCHATELELELDKELDKELDNNGEEKSSPIPSQKSKRFIPPTVEEVMIYCQERNNSVNAEKFVDYYTSNGWKVGKNSMKDWKASVRTWEQKDGAKNGTGKQSTKGLYTGEHY